MLAQPNPDPAAESKPESQSVNPGGGSTGAGRRAPAATRSPNPFGWVYQISAAVIGGLHRRRLAFTMHKTLTHEE
ncbi:MAG: hypothetical protein R3C45_08300 [Phycisphaerales bacterium]